MRSTSLQIVSVLQRHANKPLLPNLKTLMLSDVVPAFLPLISLFLSPGTTDIDILFYTVRPGAAVVASTVTSLSTLCPNLQNITLHLLPRDPIITAAVSGMLLASRNTLQCFRTDSPLTKEARGVVCKLSDLRKLEVVVEEGTSLPMLTLPGLTHLSIKLEGDQDSDWLQVLALGKLESVAFDFESEQTVDFLEAFEEVTLAASAQDTLSDFRLHTSRPWDPNYSSLLPFTQLAHLVIKFPCGAGCSSNVDDDVVTNLARTMPKLETLQLGNDPCRKISTGVTVRGLVVLADHCPDLSTLRVHLRVDTLSALPASRVDSDAGPAAPRRVCALTKLGVGKTPVPMRSALVVALTLTSIFSRMKDVGSVDKSWEVVVDAIRRARDIVAWCSRNGPT